VSQHFFEELLSNSIDESLSLLGESSKKAIYFHLEKSFNIKKQEIPLKIKSFAKAIENILGLGARFLEILIMKKLYEKIGLPVPLNQPRNFTFLEYVAAAKTAAHKLYEARNMELYGYGNYEDVMNIEVLETETPRRKRKG